jgi:hypothetical protein
MNRLKMTMVIVFCAYIAYVVAGLIFGKMVEYDDFQEVIDHNAQVGLSYTLLYIGAWVSLGAVLLAGLPIAYAAARQAIASNHRRRLWLFTVPPISFVVWMGYTLMITRLTGKLASWAQKGVIWDRGLFAILFLLAAVASAWAVSRLVLRSEIDARFFRFARIPAVITTLAMTLTLVSILFWGIATRAAAPDLFIEHNGIMASDTTFSWVLVLVVMAIAVLVAAAALLRGLFSRQGASAAQAAASLSGS